MSTSHLDPWTAAFLSPAGPEVFHPITHRNEIWRPDPFDVETIHDEARAAFQRLVDRATTPPRPPSGRVLLLLGEAGCGKTHLMRAFRNESHGKARAYCGYMQMSSAASDYGRYLLANLIDSLDQPHDETRGTTTGLMRLSTALADTARGRAGGDGLLAALRDPELPDEAVSRVVDDLADVVVRAPRFERVDLDVARALLYLQREDARLRGRVLKYLRCEGLAPADARLLGGLEPRTRGDAPQRLAETLGDLMWSVDSAALVLLVDQLEDVFGMDEGPNRFRRAMAAVSELIDRVPSSVVVVACLEDFYESMKRHLTRPVVDRLEHDPAPIRLKGNRSEEEVRALVSRRLDAFHDAHGLEPRADDPLFPIPWSELAPRVGQRTRDIINGCHSFRETCLRAGRIVAGAGAGAGASRTVDDAPPLVDVSGLERLWDDFLSAGPWAVPADDEGQLELLAWGIGQCSDEVATGHRFTAEAPDARAGLVPTIAVACQAADDGVDRILVGLCNRSARGGGLEKQIRAMTALGSGAPPVVTPVAARSSDFPSSPATQVARQLGQFLTGGGRRAVVEDADWRALLALKAFRARHADDPAFADWLRQGRPLSRRSSFRAILNLDRLATAAARVETVAPRTPPPLPPLPPFPSSSSSSSRAAVGTGALALGRTNDRAAAPVTLDPADLTRHAAFLGGSGSGKTTLALNVVEQLLLSGVPAVLIDRKGDLCGYAQPDPWPIADGAEAAERAGRLRERVDVALFTPGNPHGRPLSFTVAPEGLEQLPTFDRERVARFAAAALGGMMNYGKRAADQSCQAILARAVELLPRVVPGQAVTLEALVAFVHENDPSLVNAVGLLDPRHFKKLVQDLETLRLTRGPLLSSTGERLDAEAMLGLGRHARPGRTRLSIVSTKFLGGTADAQFWVSQFLVEMARWASRSPSGSLQAVLLFDEADLYLPAQRQPPTKEPMEDLLRRARSAGLGLLLATQSPGDLDYRCRDQVRSWFVGRVKESTALAKMRPMLQDCRVDIEAKLPGQEQGEFHLLADGGATSLRAARGALPAVQLPEDRILELARATRAGGG